MCICVCAVLREQVLIWRESGFACSLESKQNDMSSRANRVTISLPLKWDMDPLPSRVTSFEKRQFLPGFDKGLSKETQCLQVVMCTQGNSL